MGKAKKCVRNLPNDEFSYGSKQKKDPEGAGAVISSWKIHKPTSDNEAAKDFKQLNKLTLDKKLTSPKEVSAFVKQNDVRVKEKRAASKIEKNKTAPNEYFGIPNKPGTPMNMVVSNGYGNFAADEKKRDYESKLQTINPKQKTTPQKTEKVTEVSEKKEFKLKKFQNIESKVRQIIKK